MWTLALVALVLWVLGLVSSQLLFGFAQILLAGATLAFLMKVVRQRRQERAATRFLKP